MSAIERHRDVVIEALRRHVEFLQSESRIATLEGDHVESLDLAMDAESLSEVIAELERESTRAGGGA